MLDADVDEAGCIRVLTKARHQVFTARAARVEHDDWDVHAYALSQRAAVVAKDQAFMVGALEADVLTASSSSAWRGL